MIALDMVPLKTFVIERQALIAKALHSFLDENPMIRVVGDAPSVRVEDLQRTRPDLIVFGLDNALLDVTEALALARSPVERRHYQRRINACDSAATRAARAGETRSAVIGG